MRKLWDEVLDLLRESVLVQSFATLFLLIIVGVLVLQGRDVPDIVSLALGTVMGFWFKTKQAIDDRKTHEMLQTLARQSLPPECNCHR